MLTLMKKNMMIVKKKVNYKVLLFDTVVIH